VGTVRIPMEVKYQATLDPARDAAALDAFVSVGVNHAPFGVLVTRADTSANFGPKIVALPLSTLMLQR